VTKSERGALKTKELEKVVFDRIKKNVKLQENAGVRSVKREDAGVKWRVWVGKTSCAATFTDHYRMKRFQCQHLFVW
jgi:hypothetical protein